VLDSGAEGPRFKSQLRRCRVTVLGKLFTPIVPLFTKQKTGSSPFKGCEGNCGWRKVKAAYHRVYDSHHLQAAQLRNPMLGNRVWATFFTAIGELTLIVLHHFSW